MARLGQFRRDTMANWKKENPIISDGEFILIANDPNSPHSYDYWACGDGITAFIDLKFKAVKDGTGIQGITDELNELSGLAISSKGAKKAIDNLQRQINAEIDNRKTELSKKFDKVNVVQETGTATDKVMSQKTVTDELNKIINELQPISEGDIDKIIEESYVPEGEGSSFEELKQKVEILQKKVKDNENNNSDTRLKLDTFINSYLTTKQVNDLLNKE